MRIIAGKHKGRKIEILKELQKELGGGVRPTSDFARESVFNILQHNKFLPKEGAIAGRNVLDVFCGTGAFGLEALSRGADSVCFIDASRAAISTARYNAEKFGETKVEFLQADASRLGQARKQYNLIFLDPPYFEKLIPPTLKALHSGGWVAPDAVIIIEHDNKETVPIPDMFEVIDSRKYGRAVINVLSTKKQL